MDITAVKTDKIGIIASVLCMIHCLATPFLFLATTYSSSCSEISPFWWSSIDFLFLMVSFFAIYKATQNTSKTWLQYAMWASWIFLLVILLIEKLYIFSLFEYAIYYPGVALVILHFYNLRYGHPKHKVAT